MILDFPRLKVTVNKSHLTNNEQQGTENAYIFAVTLIESRPLLFTVHLESGAVYSRLPLAALKHTYSHSKKIHKKLDPWGSISSNAQIIQHQYLKNYKVKCTTLNETGTYFATIDYFETGFAEDPTQHKTSNIILLDNGQITAQPNNYLIFCDEHFTDKSLKTNHYRRNENYYYIEG